MNSKEALEDLREVKGWNDTELTKRLDIIEKDLQRNEPMKVESVKHYFGYGYFACPKCEQIIIEEHYNYCPDCGQKLDWK